MRQVIGNGVGGGCSLGIAVQSCASFSARCVSFQRTISRHSCSKIKFKNDQPLEVPINLIAALFMLLDVLET